MTLPKTMKAAILERQRQPLVIDEVQLPDTLAPGQVLVKMAYSGICGSQIGEIDGAKGPDKWLPHLLGHEGSGWVEAVGPGVVHIAAGDTVVLHWRPSQGIQSATPAYGWRGEKLNAGWVTTFNDLAIVSENRVTPIPSGADMKTAALYGCAVTTGFGVIENNAKLMLGESVVVFGAGGIGLNIVQAARLRSGRPIIAVDLFDEKLALAQQMGATHLINARTTDAEAAIRAVAPKGVDVFIDNTGNPQVIEMGYGLTKPQGRVVLVGVPKAGAKTTLYTLPIHFGKTLVGSHGGEATPQVDIPRYMALLEGPDDPLPALITQEAGLDDINEAIDGIRDGSIAGRCVIAL